MILRSSNAAKFIQKLQLAALAMKYFGISLSLLLAACSSSKKSSDDTIPSVFGLVSILSTYPNHDDTNVLLDTHFEITFDQKIDAYSAIPENFEIFADDGGKVGGTKLVSSKYVPHPNNPNELVSQIRLTLSREFLMPETRYIFAWGTPKDELAPDVANAYGIMNLKGDRLDAGAIAFTTGKDYSGFRSQKMDVLTMSPGRVLSRGKNFEFSGKLKDLFDRSSSESYITTAKDTPIRILLSQPIDWIGGIDPIDRILPEIPRTQIEEFPHMMIALFDSETAYDQLFASVLNLSGDAWATFRTSYSRRLSGSVYSTNSRRTLIFELDNDCPGARFCEYPDTIGQAVVVIVKGVKAYPTQEKLGGEDRSEDFVIGGFIHFSGFQAESPLKFLLDVIPNGGERNI